MYRNYQKIDRRLTRVINVGDVKIGGENPIAVQTMTNTLTSNIDETIEQITRVTNVGADFLIGTTQNTGIKKIEILSEPFVIS